MSDEPRDAPLFPRWIWWVLGALLALTVLYLLLRVPNPALPPIGPAVP